jgi:hypothetical protein
MADANVVHGKNGSIWIAGSRVTNKTEWSLSMTRDYADVTTFRDGNKVYAAGLRDLSGTFSGLLDTANELALQYADGDAHTFQLFAEDQVTIVASGPAYLDASVTASATDAVRCTGNFRAAGTWTVY